MASAIAQSLLTPLASTPDTQVSWQEPLIEDLAKNSMRLKLEYSPLNTRQSQRSQSSPSSAQTTARDFSFAQPRSVSRIKLNSRGSSVVSDFEFPVFPPGNRRLSQDATGFAMDSLRPDSAMNDDDRQFDTHSSRSQSQNSSILSSRGGSVSQRRTVRLQSPMQAYSEQSLQEQYALLTQLMQRSKPTSSQILDERHIPYRERIRDNVRYSILSDPTSKADQARNLLRTEYGVPLPKIRAKRSVGNANLRGLTSFGGSQTFRVYDDDRPSRMMPWESGVPQRPTPNVPEQELAKGLMHLVNRGTVPHTLDLTTLLVKEPSPVVFTPSAMHAVAERLERRAPATMADAMSNPFSSSIKLDILSQIIEEKRKPAIQKRPKKIRRKQQEIAIVTVATPEPEDTTLIPAQQEEIQEARTYDDLLDEYSLHHIVIRRGKLLCNTPEYISFQRSYKRLWGPIVSILHVLEQRMTQFNVPIAIVDGKKVVQLAESELGLPTLQQLLSCLTNQEAVLPLINLPEFKFKGPRGTENAAVTIQKFWRGHKARLKHKELKLMHESAKKIQFYWLRRLQYLETKRDIAKRLEEEEVKWREKNEQFVKNWNRAKHRRRVIVHMPSFHYDEQMRPTVLKYSEIALAQLARLCDLFDSNTEIVFVAPHELEEDSLSYLVKMLQLSGVDDVESRLTVVYPEKSAVTTPGRSLTLAMILSTRTLRNLRTLCMGREAYLVPGTCGPLDLRLAIKLGIPILGPDPKKSLIYGTKSGARRIFQAADVNVPIGVIDIVEENDLYLQLSRKIVENPEYNRWLIKLDNEFGGRGTAFLDTARMQCLTEKGRREIAEDLKKQGLMDVYAEVLRDKVYLEMKETMGNLVKIVTPFAYPQWSNFTMRIKKSGCIFEAAPNNVVGSPRVNLFIEPNGAVHVQSVQELLQSPSYCVVGAAFPQTSVPYAALRGAALTIGDICFSKKITGYVSIDFVAHIAEGDALKLWAVDLKLNLTDHALMHRLFETVTGGSFNPDSGEYCHKEPGLSPRLLKEPLARCYVYAGLIRHPAFTLWRHAPFFELCRQKGISFDTQTRTGTLFHLMGELLNGVVGFMCVGKQPSEAITVVADVVNYVATQLVRCSPEESVTLESNVAAVYECTRRLAGKLSKRTLQQKEGTQPTSAQPRIATLPSR